MKQTLIGSVVALVVGLIIGHYAHFGAKVGAATNVSNISAATANIGSGCDSEFTTCTSSLVVDSSGNTTIGGTVAAVGPITTSGVLSTTTPASMTMKQSDIQNAVILMNPTVGSITVTLPATSTLTSFVPTAGMSTQLIFVNASTTASQNITLAGGTGMNVANATTTLVVPPKKAAIMNFTRMANTDISLLIDIGI